MSPQTHKHGNIPKSSALVAVYTFLFYLQAQRQQALYDMVYVERLPEEQQMTSGLFLPAKTNPRMHVCKVRKHHARRPQMSYLSSSAPDVSAYARTGLSFQAASNAVHGSLRTAPKGCIETFACGWRHACGCSSLERVLA